ncbi:MAG: hypothetical protein J0H54_02890, partial [Rhizobiales bacterium]|nr:hypothetical protein [Hyphomicrobiales bacterium]
MSVALRRVLDPPGAAAGERRFRIGLAVLALLALGWVAWSLIGLAGPRVAPRALVAADGWTASGDFAPAAPDSPQIAIDPSIVRDPAFRYWQAYAPDGRALRGQLVSAPFPPPRFLAVPYGGFPEEVAGNRIVLHCVSTGAEHPVSRIRMNDGRATSYLALPPEFCQGDIRLVASVDGKPPIGVGTPFAVSEASYLAETAMLPRALVVV